MIAPPNFIVLYVKHALESAAFYGGLLQRQPVEAAAGFAMFALDNGLMLGLWTRTEVAPTPTEPGGTEIGFTLDSRAAVDALHAQWRQAGLPIVQAPTDMDFGYTFTALDPDGHRLRAFVPTPAQA